MISIGIDPGKSGAVAVLEKMNFIGVEDMPIEWREGAGHTEKSSFDLDRLRAFFVHYKTVADATDQILQVTLERQHAFPGQGGVGNFSAGEGYGIIRGMCKALEIPVLLCTSAQWRRCVFTEAELAETAPSKAPKGISKDEAKRLKKLRRERRKSLALEKARALYIQAQPLLRNKGHDGRAEALLIAKAGQMLLCDKGD